MEMDRTNDRVFTGEGSAHRPLATASRIPGMHDLSAILTPRLQLLPSHPALTEEVCRLAGHNTQHWTPWDPLRPSDFWAESPTRQRLEEEAAAFRDGRSYRWWLKQDGQLIGHAHVSGVIRGCFDSAHLGYGLSHDVQGLGLMNEALSHVMAWVYSPRVGLHRLQAAVQPHNLRSHQVLARLGFESIGLAQSYLRIQGQWADHLLYQHVHPHWVPRQP